MADIVNFPQLRNRTSQSNASTLTTSRRRGEDLLAALKTKEVFSLEDQMRAPANLHRLIEELHNQKKISKRTIAEACGMGGGGREDSTKRLYEYMLPPDASDVRKSKVAKKPAKYFQFARALAKLNGSTEHEMLCRLFEGCSYGSGSSFGSGDNWDEVRWGKLTTLLQRMCDSVIARSKADDYWKLAMLVTGNHDPVSGELIHAKEALDGLGLSFGLSGSVAHPADIPPVPSVLLADVELADVHPEIIEAENEAITELKLIMEIRLAIGPRPFEDKPGPMLEFRLRADCYASSDKLSDQCPEFVLLGTVDNKTSFALINDEETKIKLPTDLWLPRALFVGNWDSAWYDWAWSSDMYAWDNINPAYLRDIFESNAIRTQMAWRLDGNGFDSFPPSRFEPGSPGSCLHAELISGRLENKLSAVCSSQQRRMLSFQQEITNQILEMEAEAENRWLTDL